MNTPASASASASPSPSPSVPAPHRAGNGGGMAQQACAACKYQRRKCTPDCILAPFFPPEKQRQFINAHRLFGVSNILKIIRNLDPSQRREAMGTICFQADARALDPAGGCFRIVLDLEEQIRRDSAELEAVLSYLARCRTQAATASRARSMNALPPPPSPPAHPPPPPLPFQTRPGLQTGYMNHNSPYSFQQQQQLQQIMQSNNNIILNDNDDGHNNNRSFIHHGASSSHYSEKCFVDGSSSSTQHDVNHKSLMNGSSSSPPHYSEKPIQFYSDYDEELKPHLLGMFDAKPPLLSNANQSSYPCSVRSDTKEDITNIEDVQEHDLKGAASLFSLKNCNHPGG